MIYPTLTDNEENRLKALEDLEIFDTEPEESFDSITSLASFICDVPIALITLINEDTQWFKSKIGFEVCSTDRDFSFCAHAIHNPYELLEIQDATKDDRFKNNPLTISDSPVIFYAGVPLLSHDGQPLGSLCVIDNKPNSLDHRQKKALKDLALQVENLFELRRKNIHLREAHKLLKSKNVQLKEFAGTVSHDMKMPLANMIITSDVLKAKYSNQLDAKGKEYLSYLKQSSLTLSHYITNLLDYYESENLIIEDTEEFEFNLLLEEIIDLLNINYDCEIHIPEKDMHMTANKSVLTQIMINLITNSLKYNDKDNPVIEIVCSEDENYYYVNVEDNGIGIPKNKQSLIFELFSTAVDADKDGKKGNGIGLSTVRNLVTSAGGNISVSSSEGKGANFHFSLKKSLL